MTIVDSEKMPGREKRKYFRLSFEEPASIWHFKGAPDRALSLSQDILSGALEKEYPISAGTTASLRELSPAGAQVFVDNADFFAVQPTWVVLSSPAMRGRDLQRMLCEVRWVKRYTPGETTSNGGFLGLQQHLLTLDIRLEMQCLVAVQNPVGVVPASRPGYREEGAAVLPVGVRAKNDASPVSCP